MTPEEIVYATAEDEARLLADPEILTVIQANRDNPGRLIKRDRSQSPRT